MKNDFLEIFQKMEEKNTLEDHKVTFFNFLKEEK